jgi:chitin disaccharide deacetylase
MARLTLCADDFALTRPISETIAALARTGKLNATSCMTACPGWPADSALLRDVPATFQVGLHLTLTDEPPLTAMPRYAPDGHMPAIDPLGRVALLGRLPLDEIAGEIAAQFQAFEDAMGRAPDFVDGHQHSHVLRGIRALVLAETRRRAPDAWLRDPADEFRAMAARPWRLKAIGSAAHARGFARDAARAGLRTNSGFAGHYDFASDYAGVFPSFLRKPGDDHLVMCHPGAGLRPGDSIAEARLIEAAALRRMPVGRMAADHGLEFAA